MEESLRGQTLHPFSMLHTQPSVKWAWLSGSESYKTCPDIAAEMLRLGRCWSCWTIQQILYLKHTDDFAWVTGGEWERTAEELMHTLSKTQQCFLHLCVSKEMIIRLEREHWNWTWKINALLKIHPKKTEQISTWHHWVFVCLPLVHVSTFKNRYQLQPTSTTWSVIITGC